MLVDSQGVHEEVEEAAQSSLIVRRVELRLLMPEPWCLLLLRRARWEEGVLLGLRLVAIAEAETEGAESKVHTLF
jgi:hypothetical protein